MPDDHDQGRRRERRRPFRADCRIEIVARIGDSKTGPFQAQTVNITEHGLMVAIPGVDHETARHWIHDIELDRMIGVKVQLTAYPAIPPLRARMVWAHWTRDDEGAGDVCRIGLLFQILDEKQTESLQEILSGIATRPEV